MKIEDLNKLDEGVLATAMKLAVKHAGKAAKVARKVGAIMTKNKKLAAKKAKEAAKVVGKGLEKAGSNPTVRTAGKVAAASTIADVALKADAKHGGPITSAGIKQLQGSIDRTSKDVAKWKKEPQSKRRDAKIDRANKDIAKWKKAINDAKAAMKK